MTKGHKQAVPKHIPIEEGDIRDTAFLDTVFAKHKPDAVMHFCASIEVAASCIDPLGYYENNVSGTINLLQAMQRNNIKYIIFSSTAALFGIPKNMPIKEDDPTIPINPYGDTKLAVETVLKWCDKAYGMKYACLRYFNACGADEYGEIGEDHEPESHLIPLVLQVPLGRREKCYIFGDDYDTPDGTCVRDYIHVTDLATAHIKALEYLAKENTSNKFNLGSGKGFSVKEIIEAARKVTGHPIPCEVKERRAGDPATLIAASDKVEKVLGWTRKYTTIESIVATAWNFHQKHPKGFK
jgi:UDP-glucose 4-epimerase